MARNPKPKADPVVPAIPDVVVPAPVPEGDGEQAGEAAVQTPAPASPPADPPGGDSPSIVVRGPQAGRWRIGRRFGPEPSVISFDDLTAAEVVQLQDDPLLTVTLVVAPY